MRRALRRAQADRVRAGLRGVGSRLRVIVAIEREPAAGHELEQVRPPDVGDGRELFADGGGEDGRGLIRLACFEQRDPQHGCGTNGDHALSTVEGQVQALVSGGDGGLEIAGGDGDERAAEQGPGQRRRVAGEACRLGGGLQQLGGLGQATHHAPGHAEGCVDAWKQLTLAGRASTASARPACTPASTKWSR
jgi:hypothetical protein